MSDLMLLVFGAGVSFVFISGCYLYVRQNLIPKAVDDSTPLGLEPVELRVLKSDAKMQA